MTVMTVKLRVKTQQLGTLVAEFHGDFDAERSAWEALKPIKKHIRACYDLDSWPIFRTSEEPEVGRWTLKRHSNNRQFYNGLKMTGCETDDIEVWEAA